MLEREQEFKRLKKPLRLPFAVKHNLQPADVKITKADQTFAAKLRNFGSAVAVNADLIGDALIMAFQRRRPDWRVVHHSDRGAVYTSLAFSARLAALELKRQRRRRVLLRHPQTGTGLEPPQIRNGRPVPSSARPCSTTSKRSTTPNAFTDASTIEAP
jgi:hypothetical protein